MCSCTLNALVYILQDYSSWKLVRKREFVRLTDAQGLNFIVCVYIHARGSCVILEEIMSKMSLLRRQRRSTRTFKMESEKII